MCLCVCLLHLEFISIVFLTIAQYVSTGRSSGLFDGFISLGTTRTLFKVYLILHSDMTRDSAKIEWIHRMFRVFFLGKARGVPVNTFFHINMLVYGASRYEWLTALSTRTAKPNISLEISLFFVFKFFRNTLLFCASKIFLPRQLFKIRINISFIVHHQAIKLREHLLVYSL